MTSAIDRGRATAGGVLEQPSLRGVIHQYSFVVWVAVAGPALLAAADPDVRVKLLDRSRAWVD